MSASDANSRALEDRRARDYRLHRLVAGFLPQPPPEEPPELPPNVQSVALVVLRKKTFDFHSTHSNDWGCYLARGASINDSCALCMYHFKECEICLTLDCGHSFHADQGVNKQTEGRCKGIFYWFERSSKCPICRISVDPSPPPPPPQPAEIAELNTSFFGDVENLFVEIVEYQQQRNSSSNGHASSSIINFSSRVNELLQSQLVQVPDGPEWNIKGAVASLLKSALRGERKIDSSAQMMCPMAIGMY